MLLLVGLGLGTSLAPASAAGVRESGSVYPHVVLAVTADDGPLWSGRIASRLARWQPGTQALIGLHEPHPGVSGRGSLSHGPLIRTARVEDVVHRDPVDARRQDWGGARGREAVRDFEPRLAQRRRSEDWPAESEPEYQYAGGLRDIFSSWFDEANETYRQRIVPRLSLGGRVMRAAARPPRRARVVSVAGPQVSETAAWDWDDWLVYARDAYDGEIVPRLTGKRELGGLVIDKVRLREDEMARRERERRERQLALRRAEEERARAARERQEAEALRRRAELERGRLEAERIAAERERRQREARLQNERLAAEARASAAAAMREAERRRQAEGVAQELEAERLAREKARLAQERKARETLAAARRQQEAEREERLRAERARELAEERKRLALLAARMEKIAASRAQRERARAWRARRLARLERERTVRVPPVRRRRSERRVELPQRRPFVERRRRRTDISVPLPPRAPEDGRRVVAKVEPPRPRLRTKSVVRPSARRRGRARQSRRTRWSVRNRRCRRRAGRRVHPPGVYVVRRGDSLWRISRRHFARGRRYVKIYRANRRRISNPHLIFPCQRLYIPRLRRL